MVCNVFDINLNPLGTIFSWVSLVWDEYYNALGEAQLELAYTADNANLVKANRYLSIDGSSHLMLVESVEVTKDRLIAYGKDALNILDKRVSTETVKAENGEAAILRVAGEMVPWPCFTVGASQGLTDMYTGQIDSGSVLDYALKIAQELDIGLQVMFDREDKTLTLTCYKPAYDGVIRYAPEWGNMGDVEYTQSTLQFYNVAVVKGTARSTDSSGEVTESPVYVKTGDLSAEGAARRELFVSASESMEEGESLTDYQNRLARYGMQKLSEQADIESIAFAVDDSVQVGQMVGCRVTALGLTLQARVMAIKLTSENNNVTRVAEIGTPVLLRRG